MGDALAMVEKEKLGIMEQFKKRKQMDEDKRQEIEEQYEEYNDVVQSISQPFL